MRWKTCVTAKCWSRCFPGIWVGIFFPHDAVLRSSVPLEKLILNERERVRMASDALTINHISLDEGADGTGSVVDDSGDVEDVMDEEEQEMIGNGGCNGEDDDENGNAEEEEEEEEVIDK